MTVEQISASDILELLLDESPKFHGREDAGTQNYAVDSKVLHWMAANISPGANTIETGCGYSTVIFAALIGHHKAISPFSSEHNLIKLWCDRHGVSTMNVDFFASPSQEVVPSLKVEGIDFVLIDGDHAFPAPFIDWYYLADSVRVGGCVAVDDTQIPTGKLLRDFLMAETERWKLAEEIGKTAIFERTTRMPVAKGIPWTKQPFCRVG